MFFLLLNALSVEWISFLFLFNHPLVNCDCEPSHHATWRSTIWTLMLCFQVKLDEEDSCNLRDRLLPFVIGLLRTVSISTFSLSEEMNNFKNWIIKVGGVIIQIKQYLLGKIWLGIEFVFLKNKLAWHWCYSKFFTCVYKSWSNGLPMV